MTEELELVEGGIRHPPSVAPIGAAADHHLAPPARFVVQPSHDRRAHPRRAACGAMGSLAGRVLPLRRVHSARRAAPPAAVRSTGDAARPRAVARPVGASQDRRRVPRIGRLQDLGSLRGARRPGALGVRARERERLRPVRGLQGGHEVRDARVLRRLGGLHDRRGRSTRDAPRRLRAGLQGASVLRRVRREAPAAMRPDREEPGRVRRLDPATVAEPWGVGYHARERGTEEDT